MPRRKQNNGSKLERLHDAIRIAEETSGEDDGSALFAQYRAALVGSAIQGVIGDYVSVGVYPKGSGYGVRMTPRRVSQTRRTDELNPEDDINKPDF
jgi:hypothetical protein